MFGSALAHNAIVLMRSPFFFFDLFYHIVNVFGCVASVVRWLEVNCIEEMKRKLRS